MSLARQLIYMTMVVAVVTLLVKNARGTKALIGTSFGGYSNAVKALKS